MTGIDREVQATSFWGKLNLVTIALAAVAGFIWVGGIDQRVQENENDIRGLEQEIQSIDEDIRSILIGIEQVKARLGIVEITQ